MCLFFLYSHATRLFPSSYRCVLSSNSEAEEYIKTWDYNTSIVVSVKTLHKKHTCRQVINIYDIHDDVIKWKHFPRHWPFVRGIHWCPVNSPHKGQWRRALMFTLICARINGWVNNREAGDLRRYRSQLWRHRNALHTIFKMLLLFNFFRMNPNEVQSLYVIARNVDIQFCFVCLFVCLFSVANQHANLTHTWITNLVRGMFVRSRCYTVRLIARKAGWWTSTSNSQERPLYTRQQHGTFILKWSPGTYKVFLLLKFIGQRFMFLFRGCDSIQEWFLVTNWYARFLWKQTYQVYNRTPLTLIPVRISKNEVWHEITYPFPSFGVEVWKWISNFIHTLAVWLLIHSGIKVNPC